MFKTEKECRAHLQKEHFKAMTLLQQSPTKKSGLDLIDSPALRKKGPAAGKRGRKPKPVDPKVCCRVCGKDCRTAAFLNLHLKEHVKSGDLLICKVCRRDCKNLDILHSHVCSDPKTMKKLKKVLNLFDLGLLDKYAQEVSKATASDIPPEIVVNLPEDQLADFTKPEVQRTVEKLRKVTTVSLNVKPRAEMEKDAEADVASGEGESDEDSEAEGEPTLEEMEEFAARKLGGGGDSHHHYASRVVSAGGVGQDVGGQNVIPAGDTDEADLEQYMEYLPEKSDQDARMRAMAEASEDKKPLLTRPAARPDLEESVVMQTVPVDKPESIIQIQPMMELVKDKDSQLDDEENLPEAEQFFKVVNMPAITDNEAMITISTDDGANW